MGYRLSKIYTRTGDDGSTGLGCGQRVPKDHARVAAIGDVDETNAAIGVVLAQGIPADIGAILTAAQHDLFDLGADLAYPLDAGGERLRVGADHVTRLEDWLDEHNARMPPLREFILPGGTRAAAACHLARTVCRRAERSLVALARLETVNPDTLAYLNRLSDLLFVLARALNDCGRGDVLWQPRRHGGTGTP